LKTISAGLQTHYEGEALTTAEAIRITRTDGEVFAFTSHDVSVTIDSVLYNAAQGLDVSGIAGTAGLSVDNLELRTLDDGSLFTRADVMGGRWQNAAFLIFRYNWANIGQGIEPLTAGIIGEVRLLKGQVVAELRGLQQYLQQPIGSVSTKTCRARFADFPTQSPGNRCGLTAASFTVTGSVTGVTSRQVFATNLTQADDWFAEGVLTWTSGDNDGLRTKVKAYANTGGLVTLLLPAVGPVEVGDTFSIIAGCRKRLADCRDKFDNVLNFQGEPHRVSVDRLIRPPELDAVLGPDEAIP
jgi:uncharacterized phage protein (TIGR02218 family)